MVPNYYKDIQKVLDQLHKDHPHFSMGRHLATASADYGSLWGISNKELLFALRKYQTELDLDHHHIAHEEYVNKIVKDGMDLNHILDEDEDDDY